MKVGIDARVVTDKNSGLVTFVRNLVLELAKTDIELTIFCQEEYIHQFSSIKQRDNCKFIFIPFTNKFLDYKNFLYEVSSFRNSINRENLDIFHNPIGYGVPPNLNTKVVLTIHDVIPLLDYDELGKIQKKIYRWSFMIGLKKASVLVSISRFTKTEIIKLFPSIPDDRIAVVHNGFDNLSKEKGLQVTFESLKEKFHIDTPYISYVGSATKRKNLVNLVKAYVNLKVNESIPHQLVIVSKFNRKETLKTYNEILELLEEHKKIDQVKFLGYLSDQEKAAIVSSSVFFVQPSLYEGFGLPILEAMSLGKAVACSDIPAFHEISGNNAVFFSPTDIISISRWMLELIRNKRLKKKIEKLGIEQAKLYSWKTMVDEYINIYKRLHNGS